MNRRHVGIISRIVMHKYVDIRGWCLSVSLLSSLDLISEGRTVVACSFSGFSLSPKEASHTTG